MSCLKQSWAEQLAREAGGTGRVMGWMLWLSKSFNDLVQDI